MGGCGVIVGAVVDSRRVRELALSCSTGLTTGRSDPCACRRDFRNSDKFQCRIALKDNYLTINCKHHGFKYWHITGLSEWKYRSQLDNSKHVTTRARLEENRAQTEIRQRNRRRYPNSLRNHRDKRRFSRRRQKIARRRCRPREPLKTQQNPRDQTRISCS